MQKMTEFLIYFFFFPEREFYKDYYQVIICHLSYMYNLTFSLRHKIWASFFVHYLCLLSSERKLRYLQNFKIMENDSRLFSYEFVEFEGLSKNTVENESLPVRKHMKKWEIKA